jgi:triacylglycerol lipase
MATLLPVGPKLAQTLAILNGYLGDHLARTGNPLAIDLGCVRDGAPLPMTRAALAAAFPSPPARVAVLVHGLMCTEEVWSLPDGDFGSRLDRDLGFAPLRLRYNTGRAIADNGEALASMLSSLMDAYPVPIDEILPLGFSMGGLVIRSACHVAKLGGQPWLSRVRRAVYVGTPHRGAPLERGGRVLTRVLRAVPDPYTRLVADIGDLRSAGIKDLGDADLTHEHRARTPRDLSLLDARHPVPLLPEIRHYLAAGSLASDPSLALWFGDALVPVASGTADECVDAASLALPPSHVRVFEGRAHLRLPHDPDVYAQVRAWLEGDA